MCGKFAAGKMTQAELRAIIDGFLYGSPFPAEHPLQYYRPTNQIGIITKNEGELSGELARWWFIPTWFKGEIKDWKATTFIARIETAAEKPVFRDAWKNGRCLIPAISYSEFTGEKSPKKEWHIRPKSNQDWFFMAGLWTKWNDLNTCTMLTRPARPEIQEIHNRQPAILTGDEIELWLNGEEIDGGLIELEYEPPGD